MNITSHTRYAISVKKNGAYSVVAPNGKEHFIKPDTRPGQKLYLIGSGKELHYVGITNRPMSARLSMGLKASGKNGYHGYAWKSIRAPLSLHVICWKGHGNIRNEIESIEAEVTFICRSRTGKWPLSQTEIHFHPSNALHKKLALRVYELFSS